MDEDEIIEVAEERASERHNKSLNELDKKTQEEIIEDVEDDYRTYNIHDGD